jgi:hypothetical protein
LDYPNVNTISVFQELKQLFLKIRIAAQLKVFNGEVFLENMLSARVFEFELLAMLRIYVTNLPLSPSHTEYWQQIDCYGIT